MLSWIAGRGVLEVKQISTMGGTTMHLFSRNICSEVAYVSSVAAGGRKPEQSAVQCVRLIVYLQGYIIYTGLRRVNVGLFLLYLWLKERGKELKNQRPWQLNLLEIRHAYLKTKISNDYKLFLTELTLINVRIASWYEKDGGGFFCVTKVPLVTATVAKTK